MLTLNNISIGFALDTPAPTWALQNITLNIKANDFVLILGSNGSGKSTLLNCIAGTQTLNTGSIYLDNVRIDHLADYQRSKYISRIFQNPLHGTAEDLSIIENLRIASLRKSAKKLRLGIDFSFKNKARAKLSLLNMGLENRLDQRVGLLSGGQRQALTLIMAIMADCKLLLMDEPTAALDPKSASIFMNLAQKIIEEEKLTTLMVTHNLKEAISFGNRLIQLKEGKICRDVEGIEKQNLQLADMILWFD